MSNLALMKRELARVVHLHNDLPAMIKEVSCDVTGIAIFEQIEKEASALGVEVSVAAKSIISAQVRKLSEAAINGDDIERDLEGTLSTIRLLLKRGTLIETDLGEQLLSDGTFLSLPLTALWRFKCTGVVSLEQIFKSIHDERGGSFSEVLDDLMVIILEKGQESQSVSIVSETLGALIGLSYNLEKENYGSLSKSASDLLYSITERLLDFIFMEDEKSDNKRAFNSSSSSEQLSPSKDICKSGNEANTKKKLNDSGVSCPLNIYELVMNNLRVTSQALQCYCSSQLIYMLTHRPNLHVASVLKSQEKWRSTQASPFLSLLMQKLVIVVGYEEALHSLNTVVTNEEVNWGCVLILVATSVNCHKFSVTLLKVIIEQHIRSGCEEQDIESLVIGFIFARHASQEGRHLFPSYSQWFNALFVTESGSPAANKQSFVFLIKFLTDLVPHEPAYCLRAHVTNQIFVPKGCQDLLRDYYNLARARLQDLKDNFESQTTAHQHLQEKDKTVKEVESCIEHYSQTDKIPNFVLEASIFRKPYYRSSFLPTLLMPRTLPDEPDARSKFIESLYSSGKIPPNMFNSYVEECKKVTSDLLSGVFINVEDEIILEEPITELSSMLMELVNCTSILPVLSRISHKIEEMMKVADMKMSNKKHLILNARLFNPKLVSSQVIQEFVNTFEKVAFIQSGRNIKIKRPDWLPQLLSLLSSSFTLQLALFNYLLYQLECIPHREVSQDQTRIQGAFVSEVCSIDGLFLPVVDTAALNEEPCSFMVLYLNRLEMNLSTKQACVHSCCIISYWLNWHLETGQPDAEKKLTSLPSQLVNLYCFLAPRIGLIRNEEEEEQELTMAEVFSLLRGHCVPECARLYFDKVKKSLQHDTQLPLEDWIRFELQATWENTPIDVRITYLQCRVQQDFLSDGIAQPSASTKNTFSDVFLKILLTFLQVGIKSSNSSDMILLMQKLAHLQPDTGDICLLEEWQNNMSQRLWHDKDLFLFMSVCRCLPPSFFLPPAQLLQLSAALERLISALKSANQGLQLNLCDTSFIISCLFHAAKDGCVRDVQLQKCLKPLRTALIFHWESLESLFENHLDVIAKHSCLDSLHFELKEPIKNLKQLTVEEGGIALLMSCIKNSRTGQVISSEFPESIRSHYLKWLFAYLGLQQLKESIPFFPSERDTPLEVQESDGKIIDACRKELQKYFTKFESVKLIEDIFPSDGETSLALKMVPAACALIILLEFSSSRKEIDRKIDQDIIEVRMMELLLECHIYVGKVFDHCESDDLVCELPKDFSERKRLSRDNKNMYSKDLGYISYLYKSIFSVILKTSSKSLNKLSKSVLSKCEGEIVSAIKVKLQST